MYVTVKFYYFLLLLLSKRWYIVVKYTNKLYSTYWTMQLFNIWNTIEV